jgi:hypothetical protein
MVRHNEFQAENQDADDGADLAVLLIAARYGLTHSTARVVCELAHIGRNDDRPASGGRAA